MIAEDALDLDAKLGSQRLNAEVLDGAVVGFERLVGGRSGGGH